MIVFLGAVDQGALLVMFDDQPPGGIAGVGLICRLPGILCWRRGCSLRHRGEVRAAAGAGRRYA